MARNLKRRLGAITYAKNEVKSFDLPRNYAYSRLYMRLVLDISIVTAAATAYVQGAFKLIKRLEVVANGKDTIWSIDGTALSELTHILSGVSNAASAVPTGTGANQAMNSFVYIPFAMLRAVKPIDTLLNAFKYETLELRVTWGSETDMYSANAANVTVNSGNLTLHSFESIGNQGGMINKMFSIEKEVSSSTSEFQMPLPSGNKYRGFLVRAEVDGDPNNSIINSIELKNGTDVFRKVDWLSLRDINKTDYELESVTTGYAFLDFTPDGYLTESLDSHGMSDLSFYFDVTKQTGINKIAIFPVELLVPVVAG